MTDWIDPEEQLPPLGQVVELLGINCSDRYTTFREWRISALLDEEGGWITPEGTSLSRIFWNEPYRWRPLEMVYPDFELPS